MRILVTENQFSKLLLREEEGWRTDITLNDIWYGLNTLKYGDHQVSENSALKQIQYKLYNKFPEYSKKIEFKPDNDFGDKTSKMIAKLFETTYTDLKSIKIGRKVLKKLGFTEPKIPSLDEKIIAITLSMEKSHDEEEELKAISNVISNRSEFKPSLGGDVIKTVLERNKFSGWNKYQPIKSNDVNQINKIMRMENSINKPSWNTSIKYAKKLISGGKLDDNTYGATHYYNPDVYGIPEWGEGHPDWIPHLKYGKHHFGRSTSSWWNRDKKDGKGNIISNELEDRYNNFKSSTVTVKKMMNKELIENGLDYDYKLFVFEQTHDAGSETKRKWLIYDSILDELYKIGEIGLVDEIKYRITDNENDIKVFKSTLNKIKNKNDRLNLLLNSI